MKFDGWMSFNGHFSFHFNHFSIQLNSLFFAIILFYTHIVYMEGCEKLQKQE